MGVFLLAQSLSMVKIVEAQARVPFVILQPIGAVIFFVAALAENNRAPFDLEEAENELRKVKVLELMEKRVGEEFEGVVTGVANFGLFVQLMEYLNEGVVRYEDLMDDWWDVDEWSGQVTGQRTGRRIRIGDVVDVRIVKVDVPRRELHLAILKLRGEAPPPQKGRPGKDKPRFARPSGGGRPAGRKGPRRR